LPPRYQILRLKCTKFDFGWGSAPDPAGGAYSAPPDPLAGFTGPTSKGREGRGSEGEGRRKEKGRNGEGEGRGKRSLALILQFDHCLSLQGAADTQWLDYADRDPNH